MRGFALRRNSTWIDHYWMVSWDLRGCEPRLVESLPHPNVHVVFEEPESKAWGISTSKFSRMLEGKSHVFGIKFTPGGFFPFLRDVFVFIGESFRSDTTDLRRRSGYAWNEPSSQLTTKTR